MDLLIKRANPFDLQFHTFSEGRKVTWLRTKSDKQINIM